LESIVETTEVSADAIVDYSVSWLVEKRLNGKETVKGGWAPITLARGVIENPKDYGRWSRWGQKPI
jgi:hypothetical protein